MRFDTLEEAQRHYLAFARRRGFGIRYNYRKRSEVTGDLIRAAMVCHKAGHQAKENEDTQKPKPVAPDRMKGNNVRTDCPARMALKVRDGNWLVTEFCDDHNHPLILKWSLTGFLRSHKEIPREDQDFIRILHSVNMETSRMMQLMATLYESVEGAYTPKEMANFRATLRAENKYTDMQDTMAYFEALKLRDKEFYYRYKLDDEDRVQYLFWVDSAARKAYKSFNDYISFYATYMTNKYKMPFAPFIGINNHGQSIQLGCGFLKNELSESYIWLFESFLIAMDGVAPLNIITDQDGAMRAGIEKMFPNTMHRNCRWHIVDKATEEAMVQLEVCQIPLAYILRRWTWGDEENLVEELPGQPAVMPEESKKKMWLSVNCNEFKGLAMCANETDDGRKIIRMHMKAMKKDLAALKRETEKRAKKVAATSNARKPSESAPTPTTQTDCPVQQVPPQQATSGPRPRQTNRQKKPTTTSASTAPSVRDTTATTTNETECLSPSEAAVIEETSETSQAPNIRDSRVSNTKGRKRKKAYQKPLDIGRKEERVCKQCGSTQHDMRMCPQRGELPVQK
ncbi:hypothetical protein ACQ4PT_044620 [Festuca glaucescens]